MLMTSAMRLSKDSQTVLYQQAAIMIIGLWLQFPVDAPGLPSTHAAPQGSITQIKYVAVGKQRQQKTEKWNQNMRS